MGRESRVRAGRAGKAGRLGCGPVTSPQHGASPHPVFLGVGTAQLGGQEGWDAAKAKAPPCSSDPQGLGGDFVQGLAWAPSARAAFSISNRRKETSREKGSWLFTSFKALDTGGKRALCGERDWGTPLFYEGDVRSPEREGGAEDHLAPWGRAGQDRPRES